MLCLTAWTAAAQAGEWRLNSDVSGAYQGYAACAAAPDGRILAVWEDARAGGNDIYMQRAGRDGTLQGTNVRVNDSLSPEQFAPSVAADPTGVFWVVWQDFRASGYPQNGDIYLQRIRPDGSKVGVNLLVNDDASLVTQKEPDVTVNGHEVVIVWSDMRRGEWDVYAQRFDFNAHPLGYNTLLNDETNAAPQHAPQVTALVDGRFVVVWYDTRDGQEDIFLQLVSAVGGSLLGGNVKAANDPAGARQRFPTVGNGPGDGFTVVWEDYREGVYPAGARLFGQIFSGSGTPLGGNFEVDEDGGEQSRPRFTSDAVGNRVLAWEQKSGTQSSLRQRKYPQDSDTATASGPVGPDTASGERTRPRLALGAGSIVYCWTDKRSGNFDVYLATEAFRFPTFLPYPSQVLFERPIRSQDTVMTDTVRVQAVGFVQRRIGFAGLPPWLAISPTDAVTPARFDFTMDGRAVVRDTSVAVYAVDLDDSLAREPVQVSVRVVRPELLASPPAVELDVSTAPSDSAAVVISNRKPGALDWWHSTPPSPWWVRRAGSDTVWVGHPGAGLAAATWQDTLWITDTLAVNSPLPVPLSAADGQVPPAPPYLVVTPSYVAWRSTTGHATTDSASVLLSASYDTALTFSITDYPAWLYISDMEGVVPMAISLRAGYDTIPYGIYQDTVWIEAPDASNSPYALPIVFTADVMSAAGEQDLGPGSSTTLRGRPNPFNANVLIEWQRVADPVAEVEIFDLLGRSILRRTVSGERFNWAPGPGVGSGLYMVRVSSGGRALATRVLFLK